MCKTLKCFVFFIDYGNIIGNSKKEGSVKYNMKKLRFLIGRIFGMNYKQLFDTVKKVHKVSGKNSVALFFDIIYCGLKYQAGYIDYLNARMDTLNAEERRDVVTRGVNNQYVVKYNDFDYVHYFISKVDFNENSQQIPRP